MTTTILLDRIIYYMLENEGDIGCTFKEIRLHVCSSGHREDYSHAIQWLMNKFLIKRVERKAKFFYYLMPALRLGLLEEKRRLEGLKNQIPCVIMGDSGLILTPQGLLN